MACIELKPPANAESEMEEGEIVDEFDDLSDISSEEEFLLRQRLEVLENYNNVLERKKFKRSFSENGNNNNKPKDLLLNDLSDISGSDFEDKHGPVYKNFKIKCISVNQKSKRRKELEPVVRDKKKPHRSKKKIVKVIKESSDESEDEYRYKRRKLLDAVSVNTEKSDTSSLKARLKKMLCNSHNDDLTKPIVTENTAEKQSLDSSLIVSEKTNLLEIVDEIKNEKQSPDKGSDDTSEICDLIDDFCKGGDVKQVNDEVCSHDCVDSGFGNKNEVETKKSAQGDSDDDLELLRQHALKTKASKHKTVPEKKEEKTELKPIIMSEDEDSDTAELRLICLKSAFLKKAIEMKQKQKLRKKLSQSLQDDFSIEALTNNMEADNNTDIESVDMDIGSDGDEKSKHIEEVTPATGFKACDSISKDVPGTISAKDDEIDEDEDLLRAKLLTSLSKNLPNLVDASIINSITEVHSSEKSKNVKTKSKPVPEEKPFIIKLGESDSEGEHEATKNLTKMHMKLSEQIDFQQKLDMFLKSTRMEVEKKSLPDVVQKSIEQPNKSPPKFVPKAVRHLPKSEQMEYRNLVKRMAELEKMKQSRQALTIQNKTVPIKDTLKPRNIPIETSINSISNSYLEDQIASSRKKIAEESAKMLKLKEEATKLSQKYKIAATELRNISTAITLNKKEQRSIQNKLSKIRLQHQMLLKSSTSKHSKTNMVFLSRNNNKVQPCIKLQKENNPSKEEYKNPVLLKSVKVSVVNNLKEDSITNPRLSVQVDVSSNKKVVKMPKNSSKERTVTDTSTDAIINEDVFETNTSNHPVVEKGGGYSNGDEIADNSEHYGVSKHVDDDYRSPLDALQAETRNYLRRNCACLHKTIRRSKLNVDGQCVHTSYRDAIWVEDPNVFLCPFEISGTCKDPDCKYLHPKIPLKQ